VGTARSSTRLVFRCAAVVLAAGLAFAASATSQAAASCTTAADCPLPGAPCELCADGTTTCPVVTCVGAQCQYQFPACAGDCAPGLVWCELGGRCTNPACLSCCQFGTSCTVAADCGQACITCQNGSTACSVAQCGTELAGQCFYPQPKCPASTASPSVPSVPPWLVGVAAAALGLLGAGARTIRWRPR
jgi:hypothetical protein